jgi:serine/threonine-protein kinase
VGVRFGRYETLQPIASGGMATVHLARAVGAGGFERLVAIKVMHPGLRDDGEFAAMFLDEARVAARIRHPNVVGTVDVQDGPEGLFLVMEYVEGPSLSAIQRALHKQGKRMPLGVALRIAVDALLGLHAAHEQTGASGEPLQIVHRDVSPHNVLVGVDGLAKLTDFGVARAESRISSTRRGEVKGKLAYMCPQQVRTEPLDRRADVYAAGVVLWELLTGERLFRGDNDGALVMAVLAGPQRTPREVNPAVPAAIDAVCMKALRIAPDERYPTALAFADALEEAAAAAGVAPASPRVLAAFVKELAAHKPVDVPPLAEEPSRPASRSAPQPDPPAVVDAPAASPPPSVPAEHASHVASVLTSPGEPYKPPMSRTPLWIAAGVMLLIGGALGARFVGGGAAPAAPPAASSAPSPATNAPLPPPVESAAPVASASAAPVTSASAAKAASTKPSAVPAPKAARPGGATDWRPQGL